MFFGYNPSRETGRRSGMFSGQEPGTRASIQPIGNPVNEERLKRNMEIAQSNTEKAIESARIDYLTELAKARNNQELLKRDGETARFQALLNDNNINPEAFANARKQSQANKMRQAYSSFLSGLG